MSNKEQRRLRREHRAEKRRTRRVRKIVSRVRPALAREIHTILADHRVNVPLSVELAPWVFTFEAVDALVEELRGRGVLDAVADRGKLTWDLRYAIDWADQMLRDRMFPSNVATRVIVGVPDWLSFQSDVRFIRRQYLDRDASFEHHRSLRVLAYFVPRTMLEPWAGDLLESRAAMRADGKPQWFIRFAMTVQVLCLLGCLAWNLFLKIFGR
ncbi:MAG TPA: hypothetical protein VI485_16045 [Vicinamibacterales bacterium]|nr:hypothetical protein [Vicinamibacterales bacterium]